MKHCSLRFALAAVVLGAALAGESGLPAKEEPVGIEAGGCPVRITATGGGPVGKGCVRVEWTEPAEGWTGPTLKAARIPEGADGISVWLRAEAGRTAFVTLKLDAGQPHPYLVPLAVPDRWCRFIIPFDRMIGWGGIPPFDPGRLTAVQLKPSGNSIPFFLDDFRFVAVAQARREAGAPEVRVTVDAAVEEGDWDGAWSGLGDDPCRTFDPAVRGLLAQAHAFRYRRSHNTFTDAVAPWEYGGRPYGCRIYSEDEQGNPHYEWSLLDAYLDECVGVGLTPIVETDFMPAALSLGSTRLVAPARRADTELRVALAAGLPTEGEAGLGSDRFRFSGRRQEGDVLVLEGIPAEGRDGLDWQKTYQAGTVVTTGRRNYGGGLLTPPKDYGKWYDLIRATAHHCVERYGSERVRTWYWEIWNEPDLWNLYWQRDPTSTEDRADLAGLLTMYDSMSAAIKSVDSRLKVGGPGIAGWTSFLDGLVEHTQSGRNAWTAEVGAPLDFLSWHSYSSLPEQLLLLFDVVAIARRRGVLGKVEFQVNEVGYLGPPQGYDRYAAINLVKMVDVLGALRRQGQIPKTVMCIWGVVSDGGFEKTEKYVGGLTIDYKGTLVKKPVWNGYEVLARLGPKRLAVSGLSVGEPVGALASRSAAGDEIALILYHHDDYQWDSQQEDPAGAPARVSVTLRNLPFPRATLAHYRIDAEHSSSFDRWKQLGRPTREDITEEGVAQLAGAGELARMEPDREVAPTDGELTLTTSLPLNSLSLFLLHAPTP